MIALKFIKIIALLTICIFSLNSCVKGVDATKYPPDPKLRVKKNIEEGRGFRVMDKFGKGGNGTFEFASSNELWRASLDTIDFMPLASVNYSGGIIITDWYSTNSTNESIKISIRFLTNEVRADALDIKIFNRKCKLETNCVISEKSGDLIPELKSKILKTAAIYLKQKKDKNFKPYKGSSRKKKN
tara:strand:- start:261 stop:818 length:558 start_codon:yes stop_codon:yes gene_type:complete